MKPEMSPGWVLEDTDSNFVGFMGSIPVKFQIRGETGLAVAASSWYVMPAYRGFYSLAFLSAFLRQQTPGLFLSTTPTETVKYILGQLGFSFLEFPHNHREYWVVLNADEVLRHLRQRYPKAGKVRLMQAVGSVPFKAIWRLLYLPRNKRLIDFESDRYQCSLVPVCDGSFTSLWENTKKPGTTTLCRDAETLNWLLASRVPEGTRFLINCSDNRTAEIKGYMIFDLDALSGTATRAMQLKDMYIPVFEEKVLRALIARALALAQKRDVSLIKFWSSGPECDRVFRQLIPLQKKCAYYYYYKFAKTAKACPGYEFSPSLIDPDRGLL